MTSPAQFAANRLNAQKSTGPKTAAGKARVAQSALWHGLTAASLVVLDEDAADFDDFHDCLTRDLEPRGTFECALVERIAVLSWRLRRVAKAEAALINRSARHKPGFPALPHPAEAPDTDAGGAFDQALHNLSALTRHEATIERALSRAISQFTRCQENRWENTDREAEAQGVSNRVLKPGDPDYPRPTGKLYMGRPEDGIEGK
ncbi:MAG TPA: hypothetical protein VJN67_04535 [Stellaceae bacterium]|nr:hypothetical protein [Stellaceae bacterium]